VTVATVLASARPGETLRADRAQERPIETGQPFLTGEPAALEPAAGR
jgi:hypothetical protein